MSFGLMTGCLAGGVAVSNERGVFVPPHSVREAFEATARAFAAIAAPPGQLQLQLQPYNLLFNPGYINPAQFPGQIAQRILNPAPPVPNAFPGVFPAGAANAPSNTNGGAGPGETGSVIDTPSIDGTAETPSEVPGIITPIQTPQTSGFTTIPVPVQPTTPGDTATGTTPGTGTTPDGGTTNPGGGTTTPETGTPTNPGTTTPPTTGTTPPTTGTTPPGTTPPTGGTTTPPTTGGGTTTPPTTGGGTTTPPTTGGGTTTPGGGTTTPTNPTPPCIGAVCQPIDQPNNPPIVTVPEVPTGAVPEPSSWAMLIFGFGIVGGLQRWVSRKKRAQTVDR